MSQLLLLPIVVSIGVQVYSSPGWDSYQHLNLNLNLLIDIQVERGAVRADCLAHARTLCSGTGQGLQPNHRVQSPGSSCSKGLKVNQRVDFSCIKMFFTSYALSSLRLFKP